ncbi:MAG: DUF1579 family protein [Actinomycetota bacterium]
MSVPEIMEKLGGKWRGINRLHTTWIKENPVRETTSVGVIELTARGRFLKIEYDWTFDESVQEGLILIGNEKDSDLIKAFWIDSWHLSDKFMVSEGYVGKNRTISLKGFYSVPDHSDWGWQTLIETERNNSFKITMYNVSPEGEETLAVEMEFGRQK